MSASEKLLGLTLANDWKVTRRLGQEPNRTGGTFSQGYVVEKPGRIGFLKAFDFSPAFRPGVDAAVMIQNMTTAYNYEREVLDHCRDKRLSRVVLAVDSGKVQVPGISGMDATVFYLVFEMADGDVRVQMSTSTSCDALWCMRAIRDITLALLQVHKEMIAHQDAKPSNVLSYDGPVFKIADFGQSSRKGKPSPHDGETIPGDRDYAPPELLYGSPDAEFSVRRFGCDIYMLGSLASFLFSGVNVTAQLLSRLDPQHHHSKWSGSYRQALPYLRHAFTKVLRDLGPLIDERVRDDVLALVRELCDPDIERRGHPKGVGTHSQYSLERYVSRTDLLATRLEIRLRVEGRAA
jgi:serine/threonine protein kinase